MRRYIYILLAATALWSCTETDLETAYSDQVIDNGDGTVTLAFNLKLESSSITSVSTRADSGWAAKENVTKITGWAFVFEDILVEDNEDNDYTISDGAKLLQKVAFKTIGDDEENQTVYVTLDEQTDPCLIRLMTSMTSHTSEQINGFVSQKMYDADPSSYGEEDITTFDDYKHIDVTLLGYYQSADDPDPYSLTSNLAFPLASPGVSMPDGISYESVASADLTLYMVPVAAKLDVTVDDDCGFELDQVILLNGAKKALMRSTLLANDGVTVLGTKPLPTNLGGVVEFAPVYADGNTTEGTPIYLYPNEGDNPATSDDDKDYDDEGLTISDPINGHNPTYLIIKGRAEGYDVDGYYKIAIRYEPSIVNSYDDQSTAYGEYTYDIIRDNYYKVNLVKVDNPGYATKQEAIDGVANNISLDITVDTNDDSRNETIVSDSGLYSMELSASSVFVRSYIYEDETLDLDLPFWFGGNEDAFDDSASIEALTDYYASQKGYVICSSGLTNVVLTLDGTEVTLDDEDGSFSVSADDWKKKYVLNFSVTPDTGGTESITIRYGNIGKEIPVYFEGTNVSMFDDTTLMVGEETVYKSGVSYFSGETTYWDGDKDGVDNTSAAFFSTKDGAIEKYPDIDNTLVIYDNFYGRQFDGYIYPNDMSGGAVRLYCNQGSLPFHIAYELGSEPSYNGFDPYYMVDYEDFEHLSTSVLGLEDYTAESFSDFDFEMVTDIDLTVEEYLHVPVSGSTTPFGGVFDGRNFDVELSINNSVGYRGLFGYVNNSSAVIKNLSVSGTITGARYLGAVAYLLQSGTISNCHNKATITAESNSGDNNSGGIVGYMSGGVVTGCSNQGTVTGNDYNIGGVVGYFNAGSISGCYNDENVTSSSAYVGGVVGYMPDGGTYPKLTVANCYNNGSVESTIEPTQSTTSPYNLFPTNGYVGGVIGYVGTYNAVSGCYSTSGSSVASTGNYTGGVVGYLYSYSTIGDCTNAGKVTGSYNLSLDNPTTGTATGGVIGYARQGVTISNCTNTETGTVTGGNYHTGGITGYVNSGSTITYCSNYGDVTSSFFEVGGIVGVVNASTLSGCVNYGKVYSTVPSVGSDYSGSCIGGVAGYMYTNSKVSSCANHGTVSGKGDYLPYYNPGTTTDTSYHGVGGLVGNCYARSTLIENSYNSGDVTASGNYAGGIVGYMNASDPDNMTTSTLPDDDDRAYVYEVYNTGKITASNYVGGIIGAIQYEIYNGTSHYTYATAASLYNTGYVDGGTGTYCGPIVGWLYTDEDGTSYPSYRGITAGSSYYLSGSAISNFYAEWIGTVYEAANMQTSDFANTLNGTSYTDNDSWTWSTYINDGYPIFTWQLTTATE